MTSGSSRPTSGYSDGELGQHTYCSGSTTPLPSMIRNNERRCAIQPLLTGLSRRCTMCRTYVTHWAAGPRLPPANRHDDMPTLRERFSADTRHLSTALLGEDWVFHPALYPALADLAIVHDETSFCEMPTAVLRRISLAHPLRRSETVQLDVALALNGASDAVKLLFEFAMSFERPVPLERVSNTAAANQIGDFGLAWSWSEPGATDVVAFVQHNALIMLQAHRIEERLLPAAQQIDTTLRSLKTVATYAENADGFFSEVRHAHGAVPKMRAKARLTLGGPIVPTERYFFVTSDG